MAFGNRKPGNDIFTKIKSAISLIFSTDSLALMWMAVDDGFSDPKRIYFEMQLVKCFDKAKDLMAWIYSRAFMAASKFSMKLNSVAVLKTVLAKARKMKNDAVLMYAEYMNSLTVTAT